MCKKHDYKIRYTIIEDGTEFPKEFTEKQQPSEEAAHQKFLKRFGSEVEVVITETVKL